MVERGVLRSAQLTSVGHWCDSGRIVLHSAAARTGRAWFFAAVAAALVSSGENPLDLTKSKRSRIGFKAGLNGREG